MSKLWSCQVLAALCLCLGVDTSASAEKVQLLPVTVKFIEESQVRVSKTAENLGYIRQIHLITDRQKAHAIWQSTSADGDVSCEFLKAHNMVSSIERLLRAQDVPLLESYKNPLAREWRSYFASSHVRICEAVLFMDESDLLRYRHAYLLERDTKYPSKQIVWLFETSWDRP